MALIDRLTALLRRVRFRQWDLDGGPAPVLRLALRAPLLVTVVVALVLGVAFAAVFGVPPVSPLVLVALVVAPLYPWLRAERRLYDEWLVRVPEDEDDEQDGEDEEDGGLDGGSGSV